MNGEWMNDEWMNEWINEWMNKWMDEWMNEMDAYIPPNIRLITRSLSGSHPTEDSQPMSCLPG